MSENVVLISKLLGRMKGFSIGKQDKNNENILLGDKVKVEYEGKTYSNGVVKFNPIYDVYYIYFHKEDLDRDTSGIKNGIFYFDEVLNRRDGWKFLTPNEIEKTETTESLDYKTCNNLLAENKEDAFKNYIESIFNKEFMELMKQDNLEDDALLNEIPVSINIMPKTFNAISIVKTLIDNYKFITFKIEHELRTKFIDKSYNGEFELSGENTKFVINWNLEAFKEYLSTDETKSKLTLNISELSE